MPLFLEMLQSETAESPDRRAAALAGLRAFQTAPRGHPRRLATARFRKGRVRVRDYGGDGRPALFIPSLINSAHILDLAPDVSLLRWLRMQGVRPLLVDWGAPSPDDRALDLTAHVEQILLPLIATVTARLGAPPVLAGYCLGGTMALAAACRAPVAGLALIATPWHFAGFGLARADISELWQSAKPACEAMGLVPLEVLQTGFWRLDPARTIAKYEAFARMKPGGAAWKSFITLEDWANSGAPLPYAAGRQLMEDFVAGDSSGRGAWRVGGAVVDRAQLTCPAIDFVSRHDKIVPAESAADLPDRHDLAAGHVGMIVGGSRRAQLWEPLATWLKRCAR